LVKVRTVACFLVGLAAALSLLIPISVYLLERLALIPITFLIALFLAANKEFGGVALAAGLILGVCIVIPVMIMPIGIGMLSG